MKKLLLLLSCITFFFGCAQGGGISVESVSIPEVQSIEYKDIISCAVKEDEPSYSLCKVKHTESGLAVTLKIKTSNIPTAEPAPE